ncbi:hypothetical protein C8R43DRAFT_1010465 [Mycena crocata]|nr:hypothetical protein C8R43DRAFT_1010465 [Mycena crocata]
MSTSVFSLPVPLILLVHLHILQYPHANKPEYDHNVFNPSIRGLRDRTRTMEDVCYFLVSRVEGTKELARKVIPTYPCAQPADTTGFRTSLAKFLENLRHGSVFPASGKQPRAGPKASSGSLNVAWWWRDVVVRKSLVEECAGERFERMLLALSTHALLKGSAGSAEMTETHALLRSQPRIYMTRLSAFQTSRNSWARRAALLLQRQSDLTVLRSNLKRHGSSVTKYNSLSTQKLQALADSKMRDLLATQWSRTALGFLAELSGIITPEKNFDLSPAPSTWKDPKILAATPPPPLPIAAAHHPATLRKLGQRIFPKVVAAGDPLSRTETGTRALHIFALAGRLDEEARMRQALTDALARVRLKAAELKLKHKARVVTARSKPTPLGSVDTNLNLWQPLHGIRIDFTPTLMDSSFVSLRLSAPGGEPSLDARVSAIRKALVPKYPAIPSGHGGPQTQVPSSSSSSSESRLPQPTRRRSPPPPQTPKASNSRSLVQTSTPPETVKPPLRSQRTLSVDLGTHAYSSSSKTAGRGPKPKKKSPFNARQSGSAGGSESESDGMDAGTPRASGRQKYSLTGTLPGRRAIHPSAPSYPNLDGHQREGEDELENEKENEEEDENETGNDDDFNNDLDWLEEGPSMSVRDLLLQVDTSQFDIIGDDSGDIVEQSFGWE